MSYGGNPEDEELRLKVVYDASPAVKTATDDLRDLKKEVGALEAVMATLDTKVDEAGAGFKEFYTDTTGLTAAIKTLEIQVEEVGIGFTGLAAQAAIADKELDNLTGTLYATAGTGSGESGAGGFAGLTKNVFLAEKSLLALATGHGIGRVGPMLEKLIGAAGGPAGVGFGIAGLAFLLETIGPKVEGFLKSWAEASGIIDATTHVKEMADELERALKASEALDKTPSVQEAKTKAAVKAAITARGGETITGQIELALTQTKQLEEFIPEGRREAWESMKTLPFDPFGQKEKILAEARAARHEQASAWKGQLEGDKGSRQGLRALAKAAPGVFGAGFLDELAMAEPEAQVEMEQQKRAETAAGKELQSGYGVRRKKEIKAGKEWDKGNALQQRIDTQSAKEQETEWNRDSAIQYRVEDQIAHEDARKQAKAEADHKKALHAKEQHDKKFAREHTQAHLRSAALEEQKEQVYGAVAGLNQQTGFARNVGQLEGVQRDTLANVRTGYDIASAVQKAIMDTEAKIAKDFERGMRRQYSGGNARGE